MASIVSVNVALPEYRVSKEMMADVANAWLCDSPPLATKLTKLSSKAGVSNRYFSLPPAEILALKGLKQRAELFEECGTMLLQEATAGVLASHQAGDISHFILSSCSVPVIPAIDTKVISSQSISPSVCRIPLFQQGCAGGVVGLALAGKLAEHGGSVIASAAEVCSLVFQPGNTSSEQLVGAALFADGAAAALISPGRGKYNIAGAHSYLIPGSRDLMGYDLFDDGFHLRLDRQLPAQLASLAPDIISGFLGSHGLKPSDIRHWLFHPGGLKILEFLRENLHVAYEQCQWSYKVLEDYGNMSSATIYFVLREFMQSEAMCQGDNALIVGIGPGLTVEMILIN